MLLAFDALVGEHPARSSLSILLAGCLALCRRLPHLHPHPPLRMPCPYPHHPDRLQDKQELLLLLVVVVLGPPRLLLAGLLVVVVL